MFIYVFREYRKEKLISNGFKDGKCVRLAILSRICSLDDSLNTGTIFCWGGANGVGGKYLAQTPVYLAATGFEPTIT